MSWEAPRGNHHPMPGRDLERETGIEPATFSLARRCSTTEPLPQNCITHNVYPHKELDRSCPWWAVRDSNSHGSSPTDPKSALSTNFSNRPNTFIRIRSSPVDNTSATHLLSRRSRYPPIRAIEQTSAKL